jgi:excisionase family DNA binding protein
MGRKEKLLTASELASELGCTLNTVRNKTHVGDFPHYKVGNRYRYKLSEVLDANSRCQADEKPEQVTAHFPGPTAPTERDPLSLSDFYEYPENVTLFANLEERVNVNRDYKKHWEAARIYFDLLQGNTATPTGDRMAARWFLSVMDTIEKGGDL